MPRKRFKTEEIIQKLREAEVLLSQGNATRVRNSVICAPCALNTSRIHHF